MQENRTNSDLVAIPLPSGREIGGVLLGSWMYLVAVIAAQWSVLKIIDRIGKVELEEHPLTGTLTAILGGVVAGLFSGGTVRRWAAVGGGLAALGPTALFLAVAAGLGVAVEEIREGLDWWTVVPASVAGSLVAFGVWRYRREKGVLESRTILGLRPSRWIWLWAPLFLVVAESVLATWNAAVGFAGAAYLVARVPLFDWRQIVFWLVTFPLNLLPLAIEIRASVAAYRLIQAQDQAPQPRIICIAKFLGLISAAVLLANVPGYLGSLVMKWMMAGDVRQ